MKKRQTLTALTLTILLGGAGAALWAEQDASREMPDHCRQMMERHQEMQQRSQQMDEELEALVERMTTARGEAKIDATAAVVAELVEQRKAMRDGMKQMCSGMMGHMMGHMGGMQGEDGMKGCPMMKSGKGMEGMQHRGSTEHPHGESGEGGAR